MDALGITLVLLGSLAAGFYNVLAKRVLTDPTWKVRASAMVAWTFGVASLLLFAASFATGGPQATSDAWIPIVGSGVLNIGWLLAATKAKAASDVSLVAPIYATTPAAVIVIASIFLGEVPSWIGWLGVWLLAAGTYTLNIGEVWKRLAARKDVQETSSPWKRRMRILFAPFLAFRKDVGVRWAFLAAGIGTLSLPLDGLASRRANVMFALAGICGIAAIGNAVIAGWGWKTQKSEFNGLPIAKAIRDTLPLALIFALCGTLSNAAFRGNFIAYVGSLKRLQIPFTTILAYLILKERKSFKERIAGAVLMCIGAILVTLG